MYSSLRVLLGRLFLARFSRNAERLDPYNGFKFRVKWDGRYVAGVSRVSGLRRTTEVTTFREGGDPNSTVKTPGRTEYGPITLSRGLTQDAAFDQWANNVGHSGAGTSLADFRKSITIELWDEAGQLVIAYDVSRCWPSEYVAFAELDATTPGVLIESITLQNEGWKRAPTIPDA